MGTDEESCSDTELLAAFRKGNAEALDALIGRYQGQLHGYLRAMSGSAADADDLFQETWMRVIRNPGSFRGGAFNAWLENSEYKAHLLDPAFTQVGLGAVHNPAGVFSGYFTVVFASPAH